VNDTLSAHLERILRELTSFPDRHVGGPGNQAATALFAGRIADLGFDVSSTAFDCIEWEYGDAVIDAMSDRFTLSVGPYSLPFDGRASLVGVSSVEELEAERIRGAIVVLHGEIARAQIMPKNFTFYNPESHKRIIRALEEFEPAAVISATGHDPEMVGSQYPFPLFEDGDLDTPNVYTTDVEGERLLRYTGESVGLRIDSRRVPTTAEHVVATLQGDAPGRIVVFAHIDSHKGSPGALDNASGVAVLLGLAELLSDYRHGPTIEIVPLNGEDNYANPGEMLWVAANESRMNDIIVGMNIDDAGRAGEDTHVSFYDCPPEIDRVVRDAMATRAGIEPGPKWFQSDHAIFGIYGRPAIALASADIAGFMTEYAHSERDTIDLADPQKLADAAGFLRAVVDGIATLRQ